MDSHVIHVDFSEPDFTALNEYISLLPLLIDAEVITKRDTLVKAVKDQLQPVIRQTLPMFSCHSEIQDLQLNWDKKTPEERFQ